MPSYSFDYTAECLPFEIVEVATFLDVELPALKLLLLSLCKESIDLSNHTHTTSEKCNSYVRINKYTQFAHFRDSNCSLGVVKETSGNRSSTLNGA